MSDFGGTLITLGLEVMVILLNIWLFFIIILTTFTVISILCYKLKFLELDKGINLVLG